MSFKIQKGASINNVVVGDVVPERSSSSSSRTSSGKGARAQPQGLATVRAFYDKATADTLTKTSANRRTLFPRGEKTEVHDIVDGEFAFIYKIPRSASSEDKYSIHCFTSLSGAGADAVEAFPEDEEMATEVVANMVKPMGVARDTVTYDSKNKRQGLALQIAGVSTFDTSYDTPTALIGQLTIPLPSRVNNAERKRRPGVPANKVVLQVRPYNPRTIESKVRCHMRNYLHDAEKYKRAMGSKYKTTFAWINFIESMLRSSFVSWGLMTSHLQQLGIIKKIQFGDAAILVGSGAEGLSGDELILFIMKGLGVLPGTAPNGSDISKTVKVGINETHKMFFECLKRELGKKIFYDGRIANLEFGYDRDTRKNLAKSESNKKPIMSKPDGRMLYQQLTHMDGLIGGLSDAINRDRDWLVGKIINGSPEGRKADMLL